MQLIREKQAQVLAVSKATRTDIIEHYSIPPENIAVVYGSYNPVQFQPRADQNELQKVLKKYKLPNSPYFLSLSTLEPRKNLVNTLEAFDAFSKKHSNQDIALFVCGKKGWKYEALFNKELIASQNIFFTGFIAEEDLPVLYSHALALCYVSFYEGFGLPPLEAMACGTMVIYGSNSSMPEVIGDAGLAADANDVGDIAKQMQMVWQNQEMRAVLKEKALKKARCYSRRTLALSTLQLYEKLLQ